jgi:aerobic C4-dicarboxylate transport protein
MVVLEGGLARIVPSAGGMDDAQQRKPWFGRLYVQVLLAVGLGILFGSFFPEQGKALRPLGEGFVRLIKMLVAPIVFITVAQGIAGSGQRKGFGRLGVKTFLYFEVVSTVALVVGLLVVNVLKPGAGFHVDASSLDASVGVAFAEKAKGAQGFVDFLLGLVPNSFFGALAGGDLLQVLFVAVLTGFAVSSMEGRKEGALRVMDIAGEIFFRVMGMVVRLAPVAAFGAMAFTVGSFGLGALSKLGWLMVGFYGTSLVFVGGVLGAICRAHGFRVWRLLGYLREEFLLVLGTSSSETALPGLLRKLKALGCRDSTVGFVIPTGYSFNLDGTNIYMTMAAVFLAQATDTPLGLREQITLLLVAMVTSKGASGVTGSGFITLAATLAAVPSVPIQSLALLVGIDRFMSECRALTNLAGNAVATLVMSVSEGELTGADAEGRMRLRE